MGDGRDPLDPATGPYIVLRMDRVGIVQGGDREVGLRVSLVLREEDQVGATLVAKASDVAGGGTVDVDVTLFQNERVPRHRRPGYDRCTG